MKRCLTIFFLFLSLGALEAQALYSFNSDPQKVYEELYKDVELARIFPDSKTFADADPKFKPAEILKAYRKEKTQPNFQLEKFVRDHFTIPGSFTSHYKTEEGVSTQKHIQDLWAVLTHPADATRNEMNGSLIPLPHPYIVPGGRFREIYYWDSFFSCLGLMADQRSDLVENMVQNFAFLLDKIGHIPNGNRTYYLGRSQPPFFAQMVKLLAEEKGRAVYVQYLPEMEIEYQYWMKGKTQLLGSSKKVKTKDGKDSIVVQNGSQAYLKVVRLKPGIYLNRYSDELGTPRGESYREDYLAVNSNFSTRLAKEKAYRNIRSAAESGWDFSSRWFNGQKEISHLNTTDLIPIDLNCLLLDLESTLSVAYHIKGNDKESERYSSLALARRNAINQYLWNEKEGFYLDYNFVKKSSSPVKTLASMFGLYFEVASPVMADQIENEIQKNFLKPGGLVTTLNSTGQQWDAPNGWAPLQWISIQGFRNYKKFPIAETIARNWLDLNNKVFKATGKMQEKYNVVDTNLVGGGGEYPNQDGFGWTNGVYRKLDFLYNK